jgi:8-oxo-dGTP pyrophosphatase MutT (NUDIX family)
MTGIDTLLESAYRADSEGFVPFSVAGQAVGWMRPKFADALREWPAVFEHDPSGAVRLREDLADEPARTSALAPIVRQLARAHVITGWRDELYPVKSGADAAATPLFLLERAAARPFGITSTAVHVNGVVEAASGRIAPSLWIARRSLSKAIDPGMLDNLIGGGVPAGATVAETLVKEAWEEAGLGPGQVAGATAGRHLRIRREVPEGLQSEVIHVHDLVLPANVIPHNQDGEVAEFMLLSATAVIDLLRRGGQLTADASLVTLDWLDRRKLLPLPDSRPARAIFAAWGTRT